MLSGGKNLAAISQDRYHKLYGWVDHGATGCEAKRLQAMVLKLCVDGRLPAARQIGRQWVIPAGMEIEILPPPRSRSRTLAIPRAKDSGKKGGGRKGR